MCAYQEQKIDITSKDKYRFPFRTEDPNRHEKFTVHGKLSEHIKEEEGIQELDLEVYEPPRDVNHPWGHPQHFFQPLEGIVEEQVLEKFKTKILPDETVPQEIREQLFEDHVRPKILKELQKTKCFFRRQAQYDLGSNMPNCIDLDETKCAEERKWCESNEIVDITLIGDSFKEKPLVIEAEKWDKIEEALTHHDNDIKILRSKYRKAVVWSREWFRAANDVGEVIGWHKEIGQPPMKLEDAHRMGAETAKYYRGELSTSQLTQGLPEIHLDTFVLPLKDYIEHGYGAKLGEGDYQGHTLNFWMPIAKMTAAPLGFVTNDQTKFEVAKFEMLGSGWLFDTSFKKHTMISAISGSQEELKKNNHRQSIEFRFDLHFKNEPTPIDRSKKLPQRAVTGLKESSKQLFLGSDSE